jgi:ELWxxDGT repeat protein
LISDGKTACFFETRHASWRDPVERQLWCSDGTFKGTRTVGPVLSAPRLRNIYGGMALLAGRVYVCGTDDSFSGWSLFAIGERGITAEIRPEAPRLGGCQYPIRAAAGRVWFYSGPVRTGEPTSLWASDGTPAGTVRVAELAGQGSEPIPLGDVVFFVATPDGSGRRRQLWRSDGTAAGTAPLFELAPPNSAIGGDLNVSPVRSDPVVAGGRVWFAALDREHGVELWSTDGTAGGIRLETDLAPGPAWSNVRSLQPVGDKLYFVADDGERSGVWVLELD